MNKITSGMFKLICIVVTVGSVVACSHLQEFDEVDPVVVGTWSGEGRFYDRVLADEYGRFPVISPCRISPT